jgi:two-component system LytT family response regulator
MIKCILVDDNKMARMALKQIISQVEDLSLVKECETAMEAYNVLQKEGVDLLFLDIEMPGITGLELARQLKDKKAFIIFTTGKSEYAIDAFDMNVADYLIKPISLNRFLQAIEKFKELRNAKIETTKTVETDIFFVKDKGAMKKISLQDVLYFEAMGDYVKVHVNQQSYMVHSTLKTIEQKIDPAAFLRVHRSYIIALNKIDHIEDGVVMIQKNGIPVADAYRPILNQKIRFL